MWSKCKQHKKDIGWLSVLLIISAAAHGYNMFNYPYYENDEGTYMSQAWSLLTQGKIAPYTYWYDHAPAGWMLIALWVKLTGGFFTFGTSVNSGRVFMLVLHVGTAALLYYVARRLSRSSLSGIVAVLIFSLSPLGIYFQRRVLLDNIMIFWVFVSLALLLKKKLKLSHIILSASALGVAILTKENAIFFVPALLYLLWIYVDAYHKRFALVQWAAVSGSIVSLYFLYAALKGELMSSPGQVSLMSTLFYQLGRGESLPFWNARSDFYVNLTEWAARDYLTIFSGGISTFITGLLSIKMKYLRVPFGLAVLFWFFLMRGSLVLNFYVVPLLPLLSLIIGLLIHWAVLFVSERMNKLQLYPTLGSAAAIFLITPIALSSTVHWQTDETTPQVKALQWLKEHASPESFIIIDDYLYVDLHDKRFEQDTVLSKAEWAWKVEKDPEVYGKLENGWQSVDYLMLTHEMLKQMRNDQFPLGKLALANSDLQAEWTETSTAYINVDNLESTNGDWVSIYKLKDKDDIALNAAWRFYKQNFIHSYGQVIDPADGRTTSEGQSYAMLRAVAMEDKETFDGVWSWTQHHLQTHNDDALFSWLWLPDERGGFVADSATATDADEDIALALILAHRLWRDHTYLVAAREIVQDIWEHEVVAINGHYYVLAGHGIDWQETYLVNPSYLAPANYRLFAMIDAEHPWQRLTLDSYWFLNKFDRSPTGLPPNWVMVDRESGELRSAVDHNRPEADFYGYDAFRVLWRVAWDAASFRERQALHLLRSVRPFFLEEWEKHGNFAAVYDREGTRVTSYDALSTSAGALSVFQHTDERLAAEVLRRVFTDTWQEEGYWGKRENYYDQNWAWFATALQMHSKLQFP